MKFICAPDKYRGSLTALQAASAMRRGILAVVPGAMVDVCPIADGGEGSLDVMTAVRPGKPMSTTVLGPVSEPVTASWWLADEGTAILEMAQSSGLNLVPLNQRDPTKTHAFGTGQLIASAMNAGAQRIILCIGGSGTCEAGCSAAQALGVKFFDARGQLINEPIGGGKLKDIARIDTSGVDARLAKTDLQIACDVFSPMTGIHGAAYMYTPQKGASPAQVKELDAGLAHFAAVVRKQLKVEIETYPGAGASGGIAVGLMVMVGAKPRPGIELILETVGFDRRAAGCDLCLTGEGKIDGGSASGKAVGGVARAAKRCGVPAIALVGCVDEGAEGTLAMGLESYHAIGAGLSLEESMQRADELLEQTTLRVVREFVGRK